MTKKKKTTVPETCKIIEMLASATSHRAIFHAMAGGCITRDDIFRAEKITSNNAKIR